MFLEYTGAVKLKGTLLFFETIDDVSFGEKVIVRLEKREIYGRVVSIQKDITLIEILGQTHNLNLEDIRVKFSGEPFMLDVSKKMLGRTLNAFGEPIDNLGDIKGEKKLDISGSAYNPAKRIHPKEYIHTGISSIDTLNTLTKGQKLPVFSVAGVATDRLTAQLVRQIQSQNSKSAVVFAAMGIKYESADYFKKNITSNENFHNTALFMNLADEPAVNTLMLARSALTFAEYLAFDLGYDVITILYDMTNYCDALREISAKREEIPSRKGYPGYMYSDLASIYERAGILEDKEGSLTQLPILSMPDDDITHPIPDLTGYITEGQIVLDKQLSQKGVYPPVNVLPSLSRLMNKGISKQHLRVANQIYAVYSKAKKAAMLASIVGESEIADIEKTYLKFGQRFESEFLTQGEFENRTLEQSLNISWELLKIIPKNELTRLTNEDIQEYIDE